MTASVQKGCDFLANEVPRACDCMRRDFVECFERTGRHSIDRHGNVHHGDGNRFRERRDHPEGVERATENTVVNAEVANVVEQNFWKAGGIEDRNLVAHSTSPNARVHSRSYDDRNITRVESFRFRDACEQFDLSAAAQPFLAPRVDTKSTTGRSAA